MQTKISKLVNDCLDNQGTTLNGSDLELLRDIVAAYHMALRMTGKSDAEVFSHLGHLTGHAGLDSQARG